MVEVGGGTASAGGSGRVRSVKAHAAVGSLSRNSINIAATFGLPASLRWAPSLARKSVHSQVSPSLRGLVPSAHR